MMWLHQGQKYDGPEDDSTVGFVYIITELDTGRMYVGKKLFWKRVFRKVKGKRKRVVMKSDWESYYGSSNSLKANIEVKGKRNYRREILHLCTSRGEMAYKELKEQFDRDVLFSDEYFNAFIGAKINAKSVRHLKE